MTERGRESREARDKRTEPHDIDEISPGARRKKNTKKWCKGRVGVEHVPATWEKGLVAHDGLVLWRTQACANCGKQLQWCFHGHFLSRGKLCVCGDYK